MTDPKPVSTEEDERLARRWMDAWLMGWTPAAQEIAVREAAAMLATVRAEGAREERAAVGRDLRNPAIIFAFDNGAVREAVISRIERGDHLKGDVR